MDQKMATSLLTASNHHQYVDESLSLPQNHHHSNPPLRRTSGRKKANKGSSDPSAQKKKTPQRGMGVEKLERLRIQEMRRKKMSEANQGFGVPVAPLIFDPPINFVVNEGAHVPLQFSGLGGFVGVNVAPMELGHNLNVQQVRMGFHGQTSVAGGLMLLDQQFQGDPLLGVAAGCFNISNLDFVGKKNVSGICGELSSTPNIAKCFSQHCKICHKKKVNDKNLDTTRLRSDMSSNVGEWGFLGLNVGDSQTIIHQENDASGTKGPFSPHVELAVGHGKQDLEIVAVHPSSSAEGGSSGALMEYDFFPSSDGCCNRPDNSYIDDTVNVMMRKQLVGIGGPSSKICSSSSMDSLSSGMLDASTTIDLSLKLSY